MKKTSFLCFYFVVVFKVELIWFSFIVIVALGSRARLERAPAAVSSCAREPARQLLGLSCGASAPLLTAHRCCSSVWIQPALSVLLLLPPGWNCPCSPLRPPASPTFFGELLGFSFGSPKSSIAWDLHGFLYLRDLRFKVSRAGSLRSSMGWCVPVLLSLIGAQLATGVPDGPDVQGQRTEPTCSWCCNWNRVKRDGK